MQKTLRSEIANLTAQLHEIRLEKHKISDRLENENVYQDDETITSTSTAQQQIEYDQKYTLDW